MAEALEAVICDGCPVVVECAKANDLIQDFNGGPVSEPAAIIVSDWQTPDSARIMQSWDCEEDGCKLIVGAYVMRNLTPLGQAKGAAYDSIGVDIQRQKPATSDEARQGQSDSGPYSH